MLPYVVVGVVLDSVEIDRGNLTCNEVIRNEDCYCIVIYDFRYLFWIDY